MAAVKIRERLWEDFVAVAHKQQKSPEALAQRVLRDYIRQVSDEQLLQQSERAARRTKFPIQQTEAVVRNYRRQG
jgi:hypothetical protein